MFALSTISKIVLLGIVTDANLTKDVYNDSVEVSPKQLTRSVYAIGMDPGSETNYIDDSMNMEDDLYDDDFFDDDEGDEFDDDELDDDDLDGGLNLSDEEGNARSHLREQNVNSRQFMPVY